MFQQKALNITLRTKWNRETTYIIRPYKSDNYSFFFHAAHQCLITWCQGWNPLNAHFWRRPDNRYGVQRANVNRRGSTSSPTHPQQLLQDWYAVGPMSRNVDGGRDGDKAPPPALKRDLKSVIEHACLFILAASSGGRPADNHSTKGTSTTRADVDWIVGKPARAACDGNVDVHCQRWCSVNECT